MLSKEAQSIVSWYLRANCQEKFEGITWYSRAFQICQEISYEYSTPVETVAGILSALSPRNRWSRNVKDTENLISCLSKELPIDTFKYSTFKSNVDKAVEIYNGDCSVERISSVLKGNKTVSFFHNCLEDKGYVTVDGHAYGVAVGNNGERVKGKGLTDRQYAFIAHEYEQATEFININFEENLYPYQVQAITWVTYRNFHNI